MNADDQTKVQRTTEPKWLDPRHGVNLFSIPNIFPTTRLLFYVHSVYPESVPLRDLEFHFGWDMPYARVMVRHLTQYAFIERIKLPQKRTNYRGTIRYRLTKRGLDAVEDLLREGTFPVVVEGISR